MSIQYIELRAPVRGLIEDRQPPGAPHRGGSLAYIKNFMDYKENLDLIERSGIEAPKEWMIKRAKRSKKRIRPFLEGKTLPSCFPTRFFCFLRLSGAPAKFLAE